MSITKNIIEINNSESSNDEYEKNNLFIQTNDWLKNIFYSIDFPNINFSYSIDWIIVRNYSFILLWILFSSLSIKESFKCDNKIFYILLSLIPFINVILYFSIFNRLICNIKTYENIESNKENINRNGIGYLNNKNVYPSVIYKNEEILTKPNITNYKNSKSFKNTNYTNSKNYSNSKNTNSKNTNSKNTTFFKNTNSKNTTFFKNSNYSNSKNTNYKNTNYNNSKLLKKSTDITPLGI